MRRAHTVFTLAALLLSGCSEGRRESSDGPENKFGYAEPERATAVDIREEARGERAVPAPLIVNAPPPAMEAPGISVTAAPGVAFNYRYAFVLPDSAISVVQEQHASACEKLGPSRCRITGMRYTLVDEDEVRGQLRFMLDPALARNFGKEGIAAVERAKGRLVDAAIEGNDVGSAITQSQRRSRQYAGELDRIEKRLAAGGLNDGERQDLQRQAENLRQQQAREQAGRDEGEDMLANTPMTFNYAGKKGFTLGDDPIGDAWTSSRSSFTTMISLILIALGAMLPWALLVGLLVLLWRKTPLRDLRLRRKAGTDTGAEAAAAEPASPASPQSVP